MRPARRDEALTPAEFRSLPDEARADLRRLYAGLERTFAFAYKLHDALVMAHVSKAPEPEPERAAGAPPPPPAPAFADGWELFEPKKEYARLGFLQQDGSGTSDWRLWDDAYATAETCVRRRLL